MAELPQPKFRTLQPGQRAELWVWDLGQGKARLLHASATQLFEAPNWHVDGRWIVVNAEGQLYRLDAENPAGLEPLHTPGLPPVNNDHVLSADGKWHFASAEDGHIYRLPWPGGTAERLTTPKAPERTFRHYLHGVSPDASRIAYVGTEMKDGNGWGLRPLYLLDLNTGHEENLGFAPADGPEFSPDGQWLYFNSEMASATSGHAQCFRMNLSSRLVEQLTHDERVNWFPHPSPDDQWLVSLSYPPGTEGHPADKAVRLRVSRPDGSELRVLVEFNGGQGTINVPSWAPDSTRFAYVAYPQAAAIP